MTKERFFLAVPLGVLRRFLDENKNEGDEYLQLFELVPEHIYSEEELTNGFGEIKAKSTIIMDGRYLPKRKENDAN